VELGDCINRAKARQGWIGVSKYFNPKLKYYWLEISVMPFMLGDPVNKTNKGEFFFLLTKFIEFSKKNPKKYGDFTEGINSDNDLSIMLSRIYEMAKRIHGNVELDVLISFNQNWPAREVRSLLDSLKNNDQDWCQLFFEHVMFVMSKQTS
jgi:hypothetical protein